MIWTSHPIEEIQDNNDTNVNNIASQETHIDQLVRDQIIYNKSIDERLITDFSFNAH